MKITRLEDFHTYGGWENFSFLKISTDEGVAGWAEFNEARGRKGLTPRQRMELEASYAPRVSLLHDAGYMLRTVKPLLKLDGE